MHDAVHRAVTDHHGTRIVFRSGDPTRAGDLALANLDEARAVIVLNGVGGDATAVKTVLAVGAEGGGFHRMPIVVELRDPAIGERLVRACGDDVHPIVASQATARAAAFSLREHGLSQVIEELFDFRGVDVYVHRRDDLVGLPFGDVVNRFANGRPIGLVRATGSVELAPAPATRFDTGDRLVVITDDPDALLDAEPRPAHPAASSHPGPPLGAEPEEDHLLVVGWSDLGRLILADWGVLASPTSTATIVYDPALAPFDEIATPDLVTDRVSLVPLDGTTDLLEQARRVPAVTTVVFLGYRRLSADGADNRTLLDFMALRNDVAEGGGPAPRVVVELLDVDNVPLARLSGADDFLVSEAIGSQFIAQLAEQPERRPVFLDLYAPGGPSIHLVPIERLGLAGELSAGDLYDVASAAGVVALGWRRAMERGGDLTLNPHVTRRVRFEPGDEIVVIG
jgi:voltage-gated potassium channel Kch